MIKSIGSKTAHAIRKSLWFIAIKHKSAFWFAIGMTALAVLFSFFGIPLIMAHQSVIAKFSAALKSHPYLLVLSHILIIAAIDLALELWIEHLASHQEVSSKARHEAIKFVHIFIGALVLIMVLGHF